MTQIANFAAMSFASQKTEFAHILAANSAAKPTGDITTSTGCFVEGIIEAIVDMRSGDMECAQDHGFNDEDGAVAMAAGTDVTTALKFHSTGTFDGALIDICNIADLANRETMTVEELARSLAYEGVCTVALGEWFPSALRPVSRSSTVTNPTWADVQRMCDEVAGQEDDTYLEIVAIDVIKKDGNVVELRAHRNFWA